MTGGPFRRLQELAAELSGARGCLRATKEANLAGCLSECKSTPAL
jgi:hypothetical protein